MTDFNLKYKHYYKLFNDYMNSYFANLETQNELLFEAMKYSLFVGGKRIRPIIMLSVVDMLGGKVENALPFALALECIHTHSLIHDDLPALDNDVLRRGNPTCHVKFGEANAILAGDGLLNLAYEIISENLSDQKSIKVFKEISKASGHLGMIAGQVYDINYDKNHSNLSLNDLENMQRLKTGKLISVAISVACILSDNYFNGYELLGEKLGELFQITDDLLDVNGLETVVGKTLKKDVHSNKFTSISFYGVKGAKERAIKLNEECKNILKSLNNSEFLQQITNFTLDRRM